MAVQAQYPSNVLLPDLRSRLRQAIGAPVGDNRNLLSLSPLAYLDEYHGCPVALPPPQPQQQQQPAPNSLRLFAPLASHNVSGQPQLLFTDTTAANTTHDLACNNLLGSTRKRAREVEDLAVSRQQQQQQQQQSHQQQQQQQLLQPPPPQQQQQQAQHHRQQQQKHQLLPTDFLHGPHVTTTAMPPPVAVAPVSTGLRLAFEEATLKSAPAPSTSGRIDVPSSLLHSVVGDVLHAHHQQQRDEIEQYIKAQGEQLRQTLEEKRLRHSRSLIAAVEEQVSRKLREKDVELDKYKRRNMELEEHVKQLSLEAHLWQTKAKNQETVLHTLRTSVHLSREDLSKEGCGDSEVDDAASSHHDDLADAQARAYRENRELKEQRSCRICRSNEVSILLLPCRHLCLCKDCEGRLDTCPVCGSLKNASVQVYMS